MDKNQNPRSTGKSQLNKQKGSFKTNLKTAQKTDDSDFFINPNNISFKSNKTNIDDSKNGRFKSTRNQISEEINNPGSSQDIDMEPTKKPFDKKLYRLKKYSNKFKVQQWQDRRKKSVLKDYFRQVKDTKQKFDVTKIYNDPRNQDFDNDNPDGIDSTSSDQKYIEEKNISSDASINRSKQSKPFQKVNEEFKRIKEDKEKKKVEFFKRKAEKEDTIKKYRKEKAIKFKRLSRKTKKGQPIMKDRIEMLLEKIQKMT